MWRTAFSILPARAYCICFFYLDACTAFTSCIWRFYSDQLHLAVFSPTNYRLLVPGGSIPTSCTWRFYPDQLSTSCTLRFYPDQLHLAILPRPIICLLCLAVLPRPAALGSFTPTNYLSFVPGGTTLIYCTWRFYPDQFMNSCV